MIDDPTAPKVLEPGYWLACSDDGRKMKRIREGETPGEGWHVLTVAEFERRVDEVVESAVEDVIAKKAASN